MDVEDRLSGVGVGVEDGAEAPLSKSFFARDFSGPSHHLADDRIVLDLEVQERGDVALGHDEDVRGGLRVDVVEREDAVVLVDNRSRDLAVDYLAEEAHGGNYCRPSA